MKKELTAVDIAKDVIALVKARKVRVATGKYFNPLGTLESFKGQQRSLKNVLRGKAQETCQVCAMGAMLCAFVEKKNEVKVGDAYLEGDTLITRKLAPYFSEVQLRLIETAFEGLVMTEAYDPYDTGSRHYQAAKQFYERFESSAPNRLIAIMNNIIDNDGVFNPPLTLEVLK